MNDTPEKIASDFCRYVGSDDSNYIGQIEIELAQRIQALLLRTMHVRHETALIGQSGMAPKDIPV